jgi:hypothetical protein
MRLEARQLVHICLSPDKETFDSGICGHETEIYRIAIMHEMNFSMNYQWLVGQEIRHVVFQENF